MDENLNSSAWENALLQRIHQLESRLSSANLFNDDPNVQLRSPGSEFTPTIQMLKQHPYLEEDFFRRPLSDSDRRKYLFECPKNAMRQYDPPKINKANVSTAHEQFDSYLHQIQYGLSGLTRPLDWFTYQIQNNQWEPDALRTHSRDFAHTMHELLSDLASHITQLRTDNMFKELPHALEAPSLDSSDSYLLDNKELVEHIKLRQSVQNATQAKKRSYRPRPQRFASHTGTSTSSTSICCE
ncbi:hypothetical protein G6F56_004002 [Rhizopus delemar]|nr:hypothetical protein G6F56_004002 [Rhizopus delemar]